MEAALWPTLADAAHMLETRGIRFALIGGLAVSLRGQPRMTVDVALVILADVDQALQLAQELGSTPFETLFPGVEEVVSRSSILPLRHRATGIRVDLASPAAAPRAVPPRSSTRLRHGGRPATLGTSSRCRRRDPAPIRRT